jgi:serine phosphatase RsbU (regulator of sigma subunit)
VVRANQREAAHLILERLFEAAAAHGGGRPWEDDATLVVIKRDQG